jgi:excisionase family DNA binding protein
MLSCDLTTVLKWVNAGKLKAYKTPGGHRRIAKEDLVEFIKKYNMPFPEELKEENRILIVDDDAEFREILRGYLQKVDNIKIDEASDGFEAGEKIISFKPHIVILDIRLPGVDGYEVLKRIKKNSETKNVKVVAVTAFSSPEGRKKVMGLGADQYFGKPLKADHFINSIKRLLS